MRKILTFLFIGIIHVTCAEQPKTYFSYTDQERANLSRQYANHELNIDELRKWDEMAMRVIEKQKMNFYDLIRLFTYLYVAQSDFATLSQQITGKLRGSFDPISSKVLALFFQESVVPRLFIDDEFSQSLAELILQKVEARYTQENHLPLKFTVPNSLQSSFSSGLQVAKWIPWFAKPEIDYWPPPPPSPDSPIWKKQIAEIKQAQSPMTDEKKQIIYRWAGLAYPWSDDWRSRVNAYLFCHHVALQKTLDVRSVVMVGLYDCVDAYAHCKYHYLVIRPQAYDPSIKYEISVPKHPSYPAGHSAESSLTASIMAYFFPESAAYWKELAHQCGLSRIWAGIHFPIDDQGGQFCGKKVAETEIEHFKNRQ